MPEGAGHVAPERDEGHRANGGPRGQAQVTHRDCAEGQTRAEALDDRRVGLVRILARRGFTLRQTESGPVWIVPSRARRAERPRP